METDNINYNNKNLKRAECASMYLIYITEQVCPLSPIKLSKQGIFSTLGIVKSISRDLKNLARASTAINLNSVAAYSGLPTELQHKNDSKPYYLTTCIVINCMYVATTLIARLYMCQLRPRNVCPGMFG